MFLSFVIVALHLFGNYPTVTRNNQDCSDPAAGQHHISLYHFHNNSVQICSQMSSRDLLTVLNQVVQMYFGFQKKKCVWEKFGKDDRFFFIYLYIYIYYKIYNIFCKIRVCQYGNMSSYRIDTVSDHLLSFHQTLLPGVNVWDTINLCWGFRRWTWEATGEAQPLHEYLELVIVSLQLMPP